MLAVWQKRFAGVVAVLCAASALTGCGGSSGTSEAAFKDRAEAACRKGRIAALRFDPRSENESERTAVSRSIRQTVLPALRDEQRALERLELPSDKHDQFGRFMAALRKDIERAAQLRHPTLKEVEVTFRSAGAVAEKLGLEACVIAESRATLEKRGGLIEALQP